MVSLAGGGEMGEENLSWKDQLSKLRSRVLELEKKRELERKLERERNEQALSKRLKEDTPEALAARFADIHKRFDREARKFYPLPHLEQVLAEISEFGDLLRFYSDCMKSFPKVFSPAHKTAIPALLSDLGELQKALDRQLSQWREVKALLDTVQFRPRRPEDDPALVSVAKSFSERAHKVPLSIPADFFARETENFWTVESNGTVIGYVKFWPAEKVLTFALDPGDKANFNKFVRGVLHKFCTQGPLPEPLTVARTRVSFVREVKFFTDLGFIRTETKGPSDWIYQRELG